jgi:hypothetical protein
MSFGIKLTPADIAFSKCIRERAGWTCERCGTTYPRNYAGLQCAHYYGRGWWALRFDPYNCFALCVGCHSFMDSAPEEFRKFYEEKHPGVLPQLIVRAHDIPIAKKFKQTKGKGDIAKFYRNQLAWMLSQRAGGNQGWLEFELYTNL